MSISKLQTRVRTQIRKHVDASQLNGFERDTSRVDELSAAMADASPETKWEAAYQWASAMLALCSSELVLLQRAIHEAKNTLTSPNEKLVALVAELRMIEAEYDLAKEAKAPPMATMGVLLREPEAVKRERWETWRNARQTFMDESRRVRKQIDSINKDNNGGAHSMVVVVRGLETSQRALRVWAEGMFPPKQIGTLVRMNAPDTPNPLDGPVADNRARVFADRFVA